MKINDIEQCSYPKWYPKFSEDTIESVIIPLPQDVVDYLKEDTLVLPQEAVGGKNECTSNNNDSEEWVLASANMPELIQPSFPLFSKALKDAILHLGGQVFIKLNWSAPMDAAWIATNKSLKCTVLEDIYLLLKSSDLLARDLGYNYKQSNCETQSTSNYYIILKRWQEIHPGSEFRCFVIQDKLIGISQRDCDIFYSHISHLKHDIIRDIVTFFDDKIQNRFPLSHYSFDVVRHKKDQVLLLDFGLFNLKTETLLFTCEELEGLSRNSEKSNVISLDNDPHKNLSIIASPEFRFLGEDPGVQNNPCRHYGVPHEVVDLCCPQSRVSLIDYIAMELQNQNGSCSSDEDN